jgi:hypothetical protein
MHACCCQVPGARCRAHHAVRVNLGLPEKVRGVCDAARDGARDDAPEQHRAAKLKHGRYLWLMSCVRVFAVVSMWWCGRPGMQQRVRRTHGRAPARRHTHEDGLPQGDGLGADGCAKGLGRKHAGNERRACAVGWGRAKPSGVRACDTQARAQPPPAATRPAARADQQPASNSRWRRHWRLQPR